MTTYNSNKRKYRIVRRKYKNDSIKYYIQVKYYGWYSFMWQGEMNSFNCYDSYDDAIKQLSVMIVRDNSSTDYKYGYIDTVI